MKKILLVIFSILFNVGLTLAQCPMCKASAESSDYAKGLNTGILYLLFIPFFLLLAAGTFWYFNRNKFKVNS